MRACRVEMGFSFEMLEVSTHPHTSTRLPMIAYLPVPVTFLELRPRRVFTAAGIEATGRDVRPGVTTRAMMPLDFCINPYQQILEDFGSAVAGRTASRACKP